MIPDDLLAKLVDLDAPSSIIWVVVILNAFYSMRIALNKKNLKYIRKQRMCQFQG